jgi:hypothetical protein
MTSKGISTAMYIYIIDTCTFLHDVSFKTEDMDYCETSKC